MSVKVLSGDYPLHQIVLTRACIALILVLVVFVPLEGGYSDLKTKRLRLHLARGICLAIANMTFFLGLASMSLPEAIAIFFVAPLIITLFSVVLLGESVGPRRWIAVLVGFVGVLIMLRPGTSSFQFAALLPIVAAIAYAFNNILVRKMGASEKASTMTFYIQLVLIVTSLAVGLGFGDGRYSGGDSAALEFLFREWVFPGLIDFLIMVGIGVTSATGAYLVSHAYRLSPASHVAPMEYLVVPLAIFWGVTIFGEWPDFVAWIGISLILGSGLYVFFRETSLGHQPVSKRPLPRN